MSMNVTEVATDGENTSSLPSNYLLLPALRQDDRQEAQHNRGPALQLQ